MIRAIALIALTAVFVACEATPIAALQATAEREGVDPATLVELPDRWMGVRLAPRDIAVISFTPDDGGGYDSKLASRSDFAAPGENTIFMSGGSGGALLFGTAAPDIDRVEIDWDVQAYGGKVRNGVWIMWLPTPDSPMEHLWQFVRADGSIATAGSGPVYPAAP